MRVSISFLVLMVVKAFSKVFYKLESKWISTVDDYEKIRLVIFLNHTSLYEPLFIAAAPNWFIWRLSRKMIVPIADMTLDRPIVGHFWKLMIPGLISITRKRDSSWVRFLEAIQNRSVILLAPEGRMMRGNGLDKHGRPMSVKSGVADILQELNEGNILIGYSGGLHHVQYPGEIRLKLFKTIKINLEMLDIPQYKSQFNQENDIEFKRQVVADLESRLKANRPQ